MFHMHNSDQIFSIFFMQMISYFYQILFQNSNYSKSARDFSRVLIVKISGSTLCLPLG